MEDLIYKFLSKHYRFTINTLRTYIIEDKIEKKEIRINNLGPIIKTVFSIEEDELLKIIEVWSENEYTRLFNLVTDIKYKLYEVTGVHLELSDDDWSRLIEQEEQRLA